MNTDCFIEKSKKIHGDKYGYSKSEYKNNHTKVCIICPEHGEFWQTPKAHLNGQGCPECGKLRRVDSNTHNTDDFIKKAVDVHGNTYDYSKVKYVRAGEKVIIICPEHGDFHQTPHNHLKGYGCPECGRKKSAEARTNTLNEFVEHAVNVHGERYDYSISEYSNNHTKIDIICEKHGIFSQKPYDHLNGKGCPKCGHTISCAEDEIALFLNEIGVYNISRNNRDVISPLEIDIYASDYKIGIEYDGLRWHSEQFGKDKYFHLSKTEKCEENGIRLIHIFEDEWTQSKEICKSKIRQAFGLNKSDKVYARKCTVAEITDKTEAFEFLDENHIQGKTVFSVGIGAYYHGKLVGVMTFKKEKDGYWDLNRFATDIGYQCVGIGGKLLKYFTRNYDYREIKSFADRRWTYGLGNNLYTILGFNTCSILKPDYHYIMENKRIHKFRCRKDILRRKFPDIEFDENDTEHEMAVKAGLYRIWNCGFFKYVLKKQDE